jgi:hypothetical protein
MNQAKIQTAAQIILTATLEKLAAVHGCAVATVCAGLAAGNVKLLEQFRELAEAGAGAAAAMCKAGEIDLLN